MKVFHHNDMDGICSAVVVLETLGKREDVELFSINYESDVEEKFNYAQEQEKVVIVDYSFTNNTCHILQNLIDKKCDILWIDHHDSSIKLEIEHPEFKVLRGIRSKDYSGAALTYMFIKDCEYKEVPFFIKLISDYDTFQGKLKPDSDNFKLYYDSQQDKIKYLTEQLLLKDINTNSIYDDIRTGNKIKCYVDQENKSYRNSFGFETEIEGIKAYAINRMSNSWIFGEKYNEYPITCVFAFNGKEYQYTLFSSDPSIDCSKIANKFGGGGHKGAAGFRSKENIFAK